MNDVYISRYITQNRQAWIEKGTGRIIRRSFETFAGVRGTPVFSVPSHCKHPLR